MTFASGLQTSAQSLPGVIGGIASIVGNAGGGWIMQTYGSNVLYRTTSVMVLCSAALFSCFSAYRKSTMAQKAKENSSQYS
jgi:nitrate/nitrite transporter NarK